MGKRYKPTIDIMKQEMLSIIKEQNSIGNFKLRSILKETDPKFKDEPDPYWTIRNFLLEDNLIALGKGKGGSVYYVGNDSDTEVPEQKSDDVQCADDEDYIAITKEQDLYEDIRSILNDYWSNFNNVDDAIVEITANSGKKKSSREMVTARHCCSKSQNISICRWFIY